MTPHDRDVLKALMRRDLAAFIQRTFQTVVPGQDFMPNWHIEAIAHHLELCMQGRIRRLIITVPPRSLKSICGSVAFPAFVLGHDPSARIVCISYAEGLAVRHARDCRTVIQSRWFQDLFPLTRINPRKNTESEFETTAQGRRFTTTTGGTLTGLGGRMIIIDDPMKPSDASSETRRRNAQEWYDSNLVTRLDSKENDVIILIMQRLHVDDLVGHVLRKGDEWVHLDLPAIAEVAQEIPIGEGLIYFRATGELLHPEREPLAVLEQLKADMGSQAFSAQYQQAPVPPGGALVQASWFGRYITLPRPDSGCQIVQSWDTASKAGEANDWSVCTTWLIQGRNYYLVTVLRARLEYPELRRRIVAHAQAHGATTVLIEDTASGTHLIQDLNREGVLRPIGIRPEGDKVVRMEAQTATIEAGYVHLPETAAWLDEFLLEIMAFPYGRHDDQVDSVSQFLNWAQSRPVFDASIVEGFIRANRDLYRRSPSRPY